MTLSIDGKIVKSYRIGLGFATKGDKVKEGDGKTPEGEFYVAWKNPKSRFHRFLGLSYPMPRHGQQALAKKRISRQTAQKISYAAKRRRKPPQLTGLGGYVGIHGGGGESDWTLGCIAISDQEIEALFALMRQGDRIVVHP